MNFDSNEAQRFLDILGINSANAWFRTLTPNRGANIRRRDRFRKGWAADLHGFNSAELAADCAAGGAIYLIPGAADAASGKDRDGNPTGCVIDEDVTHCHSFFVEWDDIPIPDQLIAWQTLGLPEPTVMALTGGKSVHTYWALVEPITPETWKTVTRQLINYCQSDSNCSNPSRLMRLPGGVYFNKRTGEPTGQATIIHESGLRYTLDELQSAIAAGEVRKPSTLDFTTPPPASITLPEDRPIRDFPTRSMDQVRDALASIPRRVGGGDDTYGKYRNILWGLIKACEEAGSSRDAAIALMEAHSPSTTCNWNVRQTANSGGDQIRSHTFWWHARAAGWFPQDDDPPRPSGDPYTPPSSPSPTPSPTGTATQPRTTPQAADPSAPLDLQHKPKRRTLAPDEVVGTLPKRLGGIPRLNIRTSDFEAGGTTYTADDASRMYIHLSSDSERWPKEVTADAFVELAKDRAFDPVEEELNHISRAVDPLPLEQWERLDLHLLGIDDPIAARFLPQFLLSAVARVYRPGCGVRRSPVLIGPQWRGKTRLGRILFGQRHWVENITDLGKDDLLRLQSAWGVELSELDGITRRRDQEALKAFLTATDDVFRTPYGKGVARYQRRCVFWGTANGPPLRDLSGSTRFVCIKLPDQMLPLDWATEHRDAIWSRAVAIYRQVPDGQEPWDYCLEDERLAIEERNANHRETDPWADEIAAILRDAVDRPVSVPHILDRMEIPKVQRNNAMAARVRQLAEACGWVLDRRRPAGGGEKKQGLWPGDPLGAILGHPGHPMGTPRGAHGNPSADAPSTTTGHPGHPYLIEIENEGGEEGGEGENAQGVSFRTFGVPSAANSPDPPPAQGFEGAHRPDPGVPSWAPRGAQPLSPAIPDPADASAWAPRGAHAAPPRVTARPGGPLPPGTYDVINDPGGFYLDVFGPVGDSAAARFRVTSEDVEGIS